jgi:hypothetical protein
VHASYPRLKQEDLKFEASLSYIGKPCLERKERRKEGRKGGREGGRKRKKEGRKEERKKVL